MIRFTLLVGLLFLWAAQHGLAQPLEYQCTHFNRSDGLKSDNVFVVREDPLGRVWAGTNDGLHVFEGYGFRQIPAVPFDTCSPQGVITTDISIAGDSTIWAATAWGGPYHHRPDAYRLSESYHQHRRDTLGVSSIYTGHILADTKERVWVGNMANIERWRGTGKGFEAIAVEPDMGPRSVRPLALMEDQQGRVWAFLLGRGAFLYSEENKRFSQPAALKDYTGIKALSATDSTLFFIADSDIFKVSLSLDRVEVLTEAFSFPQNEQFGEFTSISVFADDRLLLGTSGAGLWECDLRTGSFTHMPLCPKDLLYSESNIRKVTGIEISDDGSIWVSTLAGIFRLVPSRSAFHFFPGTQPERQSFGFSETPSGNIWAWYSGGCLEKFTLGNEGLWSDPQSNKVERFCSCFDGQKERKILQTNGVCASDDTTLWVSIGKEGLYQLVEREGQLIVKRAFPNKKLKNETSRAFVDSRGAVWVGASKDIILRLSHDLSGDSFSIERPLPDSILARNPTGAYLFGFYEDRRGYVYATTNVNGIFIFNPQGKLDTVLSYDLYDPESLPNPGALSMAEDALGRMWFCQYGFFVFDPQADSIHYYGYETGIQSLWDANIAIDQESQTLWMLTDAGFSMVDIATMQVRNFPKDMDFRGCGNCVGKTQNGDILQGNRGGFVYFHPDSLQQQLPPPNVILTDIQLSGESIPEQGQPGTGVGTVTLPLAPHALSQLSLPYDETDISLVFSALKVQEPRSILFSYKLEGYDQDWRITSPDNRVATYTNLPPGSYTFMVKASNQSGQWTEESTKLVIHIPPAPWLSVWAKGAYILLGLLLAWFIVRAVKERIQMRRSLWEEQQAKLQADQLRDMQRRLYTNISHEFRTPLSLIELPLQQYLEEEEDALKIGKLNMARQQTQNLRTLVDQLLDIAKLEQGALKPSPKIVDISRKLTVLASGFESFAEAKGIDYQYTVTPTEQWASVDWEKIKQILTNLLGNAMKFCGKDDTVSLEARLSQTEGNSTLLALSVADTGPGIRQEDLPRIFDRFYQADDSVTRKHGGTGIGLALTKELLNLLGGSIAVESSYGAGTRFDVKIPLHISPKPENIPASKLASLTGKGAPATEKEALPALWPDTSPPKLKALVVEDHPEMNASIAEILENDFEVFKAFNGREGLEMAGQHYPDLIVSDVMMPEMDGITFTKKIKEDPFLSHIPVILLTAKSDAESKIEGFETGADQYLAKPFERKELLARCLNLTQQRKALKEKYSGIDPLVPADVAPGTRDRNMLQKIVEVVESNFTDPDFGLEEMAEQLGFNDRTALHRKVTALLDISPKKLVRDYRLREAGRRLLETDQAIGEIGFGTGFSSHSRFSEAFKKMYGKTPGEYRSQNS